MVEKSQPPTPSTALVAERESLDQNAQPQADNEAVITSSVPNDGNDNVPNGDEIGISPGLGDGNDGVQGVVVTDAAQLPEVKKKKKKSRKSGAQRGLSKPTGMEEFFADPPMTAEEFEEQQRIYDPEIGFLDRLLTAMQRFERTRKLTPERRDIYYKWLAFGGIKIASNIGTGGQNQEDMDKDQIASALSQIRVPDEVREALESTDSDQPKYAIDFMGCARAFLSRSAPNVFAFDKKENVTIVTTTMERFLDFLMQHDVCPEYKNKILAVRNFLREADDELWSVAEAQRWLPGDFNIACSTAFDGSYARNYDSQAPWEGDTQDGSAIFVGLEHEEAVRIIGFGMAAAASEEVYEKYFELSQGLKEDDALEVVRVIESQGFEIIAIENPTADCKDMYKNNSTTYRPVGRIHARHWENPEGAPEDLTEEEKGLPKEESLEIYVFFVEEIILQHLSPGQRILATVRQLNCGLWFFDDFSRIYPNFDLYLLNELMEDYKEPRYLPDAYVPGGPGWPTEPEDEDVMVDEDVAESNGGTNYAGGEGNDINSLDAEIGKL